MTSMQVKGRRPGEICLHLDLEPPGRRVQLAQVLTYQRHRRQTFWSLHHHAVALGMYPEVIVAHLQSRRPQQASAKVPGRHDSKEMTDTKEMANAKVMPSRGSRQESTATDPATDLHSAPCLKAPILEPTLQESSLLAPTCRPLLPSNPL